MKQKKFESNGKLKPFVCTIESFDGTKKDCRIFANTAEQARDKLSKQFPNCYVEKAVPLREYLEKRNPIILNHEIENFAYDWIFELVNDMSIIKTSYEERNASWEKFVEYAIGLERWKSTV